MTVGENIRRIRKERGLTIKELGDMVGVSESYIRAYESGRRNPKASSLQSIASALAVNVAVLENSDFDGITAMHRLFQIFRQYGGELFELTESDDSSISICFNNLCLIRPWFNRYEQYLKEIEVANNLKSNAERANALFAAEESFDIWMDMFPEYIEDPELLEIQSSYDRTMDFLGTTPKNPE